MGALSSVPQRKPEDYRQPDPNTFPVYEPNQQHFVTEPNECIPIKLAKEGVAAEKPVTLFHLFEQAVLKCGNTPALAVEIPENGEYTGKWTFWSWENYQSDAHKFARALVRLGVQKFQSVSILGFNSPEWMVSHFGAIHAGCKGVGIYQTNGPEAVKYILEHSGSRVVVVENEEQLDKIREVYKELPELLAVVVYRPKTPAGMENAKQAMDIPVYGWNDFLRLGTGDEMKEWQAEVEARVKSMQPGHACSLIYTSGTTGPPKAVMISHDNCSWTVKTLLYNLEDIVKMEHLKGISYLPLSHIAAQLSDVYAPLLMASLGIKATVYCARPDALRGSLGGTLKAVRPTMFFGVPRVWEKMAEGIQAVGANSKGFKKKIASWAKSKAGEAFENEQVGGNGKVPVGTGIAEKLLGKVKDALGFGDCEYFLTGAAPIQPQTLRYFGSLGISILELYGMSECTGPQTVSKKHYHKIGSCGPSLLGCELKIDHDATRDKPSEGEICYRGRHIMMGYMKNPEKSRETIDPQGWLHSGDVGRLDADGLLYITGRIKELIITAGGENIAPVPVEDFVQEKLPALSGCMMVGDKRKFNTMLLTLRCKPDEKDSSQFTDELDAKALAVNPAVKTVTGAQTDQVWRDYIQAGIDAYNRTAVSNAQKVQKWVILKHNFTVAGGELTPTMKLKRSVVAEKYHDIIEQMYA